LEQESRAIALHAEIGVSRFQDQSRNFRRRDEFGNASANNDGGSGNESI
jgi:hypothetical protein